MKKKKNLIVPLRPPPFFAILRYSVLVSRSSELSKFDGRGLLETVTISKEMQTIDKIYMF